MKPEGWDRRLAAAIDAAAAGRAFAWGRHDCVTWAFEVRRDLTQGEDTAALWRGRYRTARGAARVMRRLGWTSLREAGVALLGEPLATPLLAQRGDLVLGGDPEALGICLGATVAFLAPVGLTTLPLVDCHLAWRV